MNLNLSIFMLSLKVARILGVVYVVHTVKWGSGCESSGRLQEVKMVENFKSSPHPSPLRKSGRCLREGPSSLENLFVF